MDKTDGRNYWDAATSLTPTAQQLHGVNALSRPYEDAPLDITLFVACKNDQDYVLQTLNTIIEAMASLELSYEIIVIDDASTDASAERVREFILEHPELAVTLRINSVPKGLAQNYYDVAFMGKGKYLRMMYGDSAETMETLIDVLRAVGEADILIPYYIDSLHRESDGQRMPKLYASILNYFTKYRLKDYSLCSVHLRYSVMRWHGNTRGNGFQVELLCRLLDLGFTYKQMPSRSIERHPNRLSGDTIFYNFISIGQTVFHIVLRRLTTGFQEL